MSLQIRQDSTKDEEGDRVFDGILAQRIRITPSKGARTVPRVQVSYLTAAPIFLRVRDSSTWSHRKMSPVESMRDVRAEGQAFALMPAASALSVARRSMTYSAIKFAQHYSNGLTM